MIHQPIAEQVIVFFASHFERIFSDPFRSAISDLLRRRAVLRQVDESADAASQSLTRLLINEQLSNTEASHLLQGLEPSIAALNLERIANPNISPEALVVELLKDHPPSIQLTEIQQVLLRVALHSVVQVMTLVGPVMAEWQKLNFSDSFEPPKKIVDRLNRISEQINTQGQPNPAKDERYELNYRDYLMQRFYRVEAGTVKMTTNLNVDLRELFVMPKVLLRNSKEEASSDSTELMDLNLARQRFDDNRFSPGSLKHEKPAVGISALEQIKQAERTVLVGAPGSGKSTFLEWLQIQLAMGDEELPMNGQQAIPLLLRIRQLDVQNLPEGIELIAKATASDDRAKLMPHDWIDRQMAAGRVIFMLDGLDETHPELRDAFVLPWLQRLCERYPDCRFLVSSRPSGYPSGTLSALDFKECDLLDFAEDEIAEYTRHWCTAVRLARNEPTEEAREEGQKDGAQIVEGFRENTYICDLARNPLMLSAICLVNYFEGGKLPEDRALLYRLCVEGLLHHWDHRRGIHSEFGLEEKLRACRELALAMQMDDKAEYELERVRAVFAKALADGERADNLLEHIRYRAGLLVERRPEVFAFAHLTFQEYLAAQAIHEGNHLGLNAEHLVKGHKDPRWQEVIALFCGLSTDVAALTIIRSLMAQPNSLAIGSVLAEAYRAAKGRIGKNKEFRTSVIERIALAPINRESIGLSIFPEDEVSPIANLCLGKTDTLANPCGAYFWLDDHKDKFDFAMQFDKLKRWQQFDPNPLAEIVYLLHKLVSYTDLLNFSGFQEIYLSPGPSFPSVKYACQAEIALIGISDRKQNAELELQIKVMLTIFRVLRQFAQPLSVFVLMGLHDLSRLPLWEKPLPNGLKPFADELAVHARKLLQRFPSDRYKETKDRFIAWIEQLEKPTSQKKLKTKQKRNRR
ncbi:MAG: NACHT domain-containing protein [Methylobacter sp.]|nr:NACHT domain-containing protein [Methylobacter sp.]